MSEMNTVTVIIFGQEYTLSGDMPREYIMKLADKVDEMMKEVSDGKNQTVSKTAVLAAMLITDELFKEKDKSEGLAAENTSLNSQVSNYAALWEDAKCSLASSREETDRLIESLKSRIAAQEAAIAEAKTATPESEHMIAELENRCRDVESSFFDLQMENIRLKNELENYKNRGY